MPFYFGMAITKQKKETIVRDVADALQGSASMVFVHFKGLDVTDTTEMRQALREKGIGYRVAKKSLVRRALNATSLEGEMPPMEGEIALAYGSDPVAPAREINEFVKKHSDKLSIVGGIFEKRYLDKAEMNALANIPPLQVLYGQLVNVINSPIQGLAVALNAVAEKRG